MKILKKILKPYFKFYHDGHNLKFKDGSIIPATRNLWSRISTDAKDVATNPIESDKDFVDALLKNSPDGTKIIQFSKTIVPRKHLKLMFPENIDNKKFWKKLNEGYKILSITNAPAQDEYEANMYNREYASTRGTERFITKFIEEKLRENKVTKILEIGYGFGSFADWLHNRFPYQIISGKNLEYYGIDIVKRNDKYKNTYETDGWKIPKEIPNVDMVYSVNVFQHLSKKQRLNYFKKAYNKLNNNGHMIFSSFIMTETNKDSVVWGLVDEKGTGYCHFFSQPTEVDKEDDLRKELNDIGFDIDSFSVTGINHLFCILTKRKRVLTEADPYGEEIWEDVK